MKPSVGSRLCLLAAATLVAGAVACGDDAGRGDDGGTSSSTECSQAGFTETGCTCPDSDRPGSHTCSAELTWTECSCPPPRPDPTQCQEQGQPVVCNPCPPDMDAWVTECTAELTFDCSCSADDAGTDADGG